MPVVPTPPTISDGIVPSSAWNQFRDAIRFLLSPPLAELRQTSAQTLLNATWTTLTFDVEDVDTDVNGVGGHSTSVLTSRYTARYPGWYAVAGAVSFQTNGTGMRGAKLQVNGVDIAGGQILLPTQSTSANIVPARVRQVYLTLGDFVELLGFQASGGGSLDTSVASGEQSHMSVRWVSL